MKRFHIILIAAALVAFVDRAEARTKITIEGADVTLDLLREKGILDQLAKAFPDPGDDDERQRLEAAVAEILKSYREGEKVKDLTADKFHDYLAFDYEFLFRNVLRDQSLDEFIAQQQELVKRVADHPDLYKSRVVTAGFEHQFATYLSRYRAEKKSFKFVMVTRKDADATYSTKQTAQYLWYKANCLDGFVELDHVEIAKSTIEINGLPFILETDSNAELELVTPPFLLRTAAPDIAVPDPDQVLHYETMMTRFMLALGEHKVPGQRGLLKLSDLLQYFQQRGLKFEVKDNLEIHPSQVTHKTPVPVTKRFSRVELARLCIHKILTPYIAGDYRVDSQVNFSATPEVYSALKYLRLAQYTEKDDNFDYYTLWFSILSELKKGVTDGKPSLGHMMFLVELATVATNQVAVPALDAYYRFTRDRFDATAERWSDEDKDVLDDIEGATSFVKDWGGVWLKTSLRNFTKAVLHENELAAQAQGSKALGTAIFYALPRKTDLAKPFTMERLERELKRFAEALNAGLNAWVTDHALDNDFVMPAPASPTPSETEGSPTPASNETSPRDLGNQKPSVHPVVKRLEDLAVLQPAAKAPIEYTFHNPAYLGPRQDTFIGDEKSNRPLLGIWGDRKLFVVEVREPAPHRDFLSLAWTLNFLGNPEDQDDRAMIEKRGIVRECVRPNKLTPNACLELLVRKLYDQDGLARPTN